MKAIYFKYYLKIKPFIFWSKESIANNATNVMFIKYEMCIVLHILLLWPFEGFPI